MSTLLEDRDRLLEPMPGENPAGVDPRLDESVLSPFRQVKDAREEARRLERQADLEGDDSIQATPQWRTVRDQGFSILEEQAKDLEVVAYLIEALLRLEGIRGLADGFALARELVDRFWGSLYPEPDEDGIETTLLPLSRLNGDVLVDPINRIVVTQGTSLGPFRLWQYRQAQELTRQPVEEQEERVARGAVNMVMFQRAVSETPPTFFRQLLKDLQDCRDELSQLRDILEIQAGSDAPTFSRVDEALEDAQVTLRLIAGSSLQETEEPTAGAPSVGGNGAAVAAGSLLDNAIPNREAALNTLLKVAEYFERTEPQSILPSEIRKIVRRGRMTPEELYRDLISDEGVLRQLFRDVGIEDRSSEEID